MSSPNFHPPHFPTSYSSPNKPMGPPSMPPSPVLGPSITVTRSPHPKDPRSSPYDVPRTPPSDPRLHGLQQSPGASPFPRPLEVTPTKSDIRSRKVMDSVDPRKAGCLLTTGSPRHAGLSN